MIYLVEYMISVSGLHVCPQALPQARLHELEGVSVPPI